MLTISQWWMWLVFALFVIIVLAIDLLCFTGRRSYRVSTKKALSWTIAWFLTAIIFNLLLWVYLKNTYNLAIANQKSIEFFTGYLIEKSLSVDNIFVFLMLFSYFKIPPEYQRRVLIYGVIGAIVMRFILILAGIFLVNKFAWILFVFGLFLVFTGVKLLFSSGQKADLSENKLLIWLKTKMRMTSLQKEKFFIRRNGVLFFTPLFLALVFIEISDLIFAMDSIPAIFAVTRDPFIIFTSNIFAVMGLRALYFLLMNLHERFHLLKYGIAFILMFVGIKMLLAEWMPIPTTISLYVIVTILLIAIMASLHHTKNGKKI